MEFVIIIYHFCVSIFCYALILVLFSFTGKLGICWFCLAIAYFQFVVVLLVTVEVMVDYYK